MLIFAVDALHFRCNTYLSAGAAVSLKTVLRGVDDGNTIFCTSLLASVHFASGSKALFVLFSFLEIMQELLSRVRQVR